MISFEPEMSNSPLIAQLAALFPAVFLGPQEMAFLYRNILWKAKLFSSIGVEFKTDL